jgi:hypothetical protein
MFETDAFKEQLRETIGLEAARQGMARYETAIVGRLQSLAVQNEPTLMGLELRKTASVRRGIPDALASAQSLIKAASARASAARRTLVTDDDVVAAYQAQFCQVWPFCRSRE